MANQDGGDLLALDFDSRYGRLSDDFGTLNAIDDALVENMARSDLFLQEWHNINNLMIVHKDLSVTFSKILLRVIEQKEILTRCPRVLKNDDAVNILQEHLHEPVPENLVNEAMDILEFSICHQNKLAYTDRVLKALGLSREALRTSTSKNIRKLMLSDDSMQDLQYSPELPMIDREQELPNSLTRSRHISDENEQDLDHIPDTPLSSSPARQPPTVEDHVELLLARNKRYRDKAMYYESEATQAKRAKREACSALEAIKVTHEKELKNLELRLVGERQDELATIPRQEADNMVQEALKNAITKFKSQRILMSKELAYARRESSKQKESSAQFEKELKKCQESYSSWCKKEKENHARVYAEARIELNQVVIQRNQAHDQLAHVESELRDCLKGVNSSPSDSQEELGLLRARCDLNQIIQAKESDIHRLEEEAKSAEATFDKALDDKEIQHQMELESLAAAMKKECQEALLQHKRAIQEMTHKKGKEYQELKDGHGRVLQELTNQMNSTHQATVDRYEKAAEEMKSRNEEKYKSASALHLTTVKDLKSEMNRQLLDAQATHDAQIKALEAAKDHEIGLQETQHQREIDEVKCQVEGQRKASTTFLKKHFKKAKALYVKEHQLKITNLIVDQKAFRTRKAEDFKHVIELHHEAIELLKDQQACDLEETNRKHIKAITELNTLKDKRYQQMLDQHQKDFNELLKVKASQMQNIIQCHQSDISIIRTQVSAMIGEMMTEDSNRIKVIEDTYEKQIKHLQTEHQDHRNKQDNVIQALESARTTLGAHHATQLHALRTQREQEQSHWRKAQNIIKETHQRQIDVLKDARCQDQLDHVRNLEKQRDSYLSIETSHQIEVDNLRNRLEASTSSHESFMANNNQVLAALASSLKQTNFELSTSKEKLNSTRTFHVDVIEPLMDQLQDEITTRTVERDLLSNSFDLMTLERDKQLKDLEIRTKQLLEMTSERDGLLIERSSLQADLVNRTEERDGLLSDLCNKTREKDAIQLNLVNITHERDSLQLDIVNKTQEKNALQLDLVNRTEERDAFQSDLVSRTKERDGLLSDLVDRTHQRDTLQSDLVSRTEERDSLLSDLVNRTHQRDALQSDLVTRTEERDSALSIVHNLTDNNNRLQNQSRMTRQRAIESGILTLRNLLPEEKSYAATRSIAKLLLDSLPPMTINKCKFDPIFYGICSTSSVAISDQQQMLSLAARLYIRIYTMSYGQEMLYLISILATKLNQCKELRIVHLLLEAFRLLSSRDKTSHQPRGTAVALVVLGLGELLRRLSVKFTLCPEKYQQLREDLQSLTSSNDTASLPINKVSLFGRLSSLPVELKKVFGVNCVNNQHGTFCSVEESSWILYMNSKQTTLILINKELVTRVEDEQKVMYRIKGQKGFDEIVLLVKGDEQAWWENIIEPDYQVSEEMKAVLQGVLSVEFLDVTVASWRS